MDHRAKFRQNRSICCEDSDIFTVRRYAKRSICRRRVSVCVCMCLSVTLRYCIKTVKRRITQITPHDSERTGSPPTGMTNAGGVG